MTGGNTYILLQLPNGLLIEMDFISHSIGTLYIDTAKILMLV